MPEIILAPTQLERSVAPESLPPTMGRVLQRCDITWLAGRIRRGAGMARTKITPTTSTRTNTGVFQRRDGRRMIVDSGADGNIRLTIGNGAVGCASSLVEWDDATDYITSAVFDETHEEETGPHNQGGGVY